MTIACQGGDPNNINKVISEILALLKKPDHESMTADDIQINSLEDVIRLISKVPDGLRHLRNYAKKRIMIKQAQNEMKQVFHEIYKFAQSNKEEVIQIAGLKKSDITECAEIMRQAYQTERMDEREGLIKMGLNTMTATYKDQKFYVAMCKEII